MKNAKNKRAKALNIKPDSMLYKNFMKPPIIYIRFYSMLELFHRLTFP